MLGRGDEGLRGIGVSESGYNGVPSAPRTVAATPLFQACLRVCICTVCVCVCVYVYVCMCADMYICIYMHVCMYMYMYAFIYMYMCLCMHICA